jgi:GntR family transcriptional regulator, transcriptional repressor for pyruvate dehydrogenase complex
LARAARRPTEDLISDRLSDAVLQTVRGVNTFESTVEALAGAIRLGVFPNGQRLPPERELAVRLGVSRMTLREAIAAVRDAGLVTTQAGRGGGTVVTYAAQLPSTPDTDQLRRRGPQLLEALDFRRIIEPGAAYLAAERALSGDQRAWLSDSLEACGRTTDGAEHRVLDSRLHLAIATCTGSPMVVEAVTRAQYALNDMLRAIPVLPRNIEHSHEQHRAIVHAILRGAAPEARRVMEEHCDATCSLLKGLLG